MIRVGWSVAGFVESWRSRQSTSIRRPMVSTLGLTRSNGSVSHAGNSTTESVGHELAQVVVQLAGIGACRSGDQQRVAIAELGECCHRDRARRLGYGDQRRRASEGLGQPGVVAEQARE